MRKDTLSEEDSPTLSNICRSAAEKHGDFAEELRKAKKARSAGESRGMPFGAAARSLADSIDRRQRRYADKFDMAVEATLPLDPDEEPESPPPSP